MTNTVLFTVEEAAELADIKPSLLKLWLETNNFKPSSLAKVTNMGMGGPIITYYFSESDIASLIQFAKNQEKQKPMKEVRFVDDGTLDTFTVSQIASLWQLSRDTIQRLFQDEPGVQTLGERNPRGKRPRVTLRIPRAVMERVKKRRSNS
jgi:hypothetical protein